MDLRNRLLKNSKLAVALEDSDIFTEQDFVSTNIPVLDIALSGAIGMGLSRGLTIVAGPSKHFKSFLGMIAVCAYMKKYPESVCMFYDSEYGTTPEYFAAVGIDPTRVIHTPIRTLEEFREDLTNQLENIQKGEKVIFFVDSLGNVASKKEVDDAISGKEAADMTRAKVMKSITRIAMGYLNTKHLPMIAVGHTYDTMEMYSKKVLSGGSGIYYNANNIIFVGRRQNKKDGELLGYDFVLNIEKSRFVKEGTQLPLKVTYKDGVFRYAGLLDVALDGGYVVKPKIGWYTRPCVTDDKSFRENEVDTSKEFWEPIFKNTDFLEYVKTKFQTKTAIFKEGTEYGETSQEDTPDGN